MEDSVECVLNKSMTLFDGILLLLAMLGLTYIFVYSLIMDMIKLRPLWEKSKFLKELFHCSMCCSVWFGLYGVLAIYVKQHYDSIWYYLMTVPFASSAFCYSVDRIVCLADDVINKLREPIKKDG